MKETGTIKGEAAEGTEEKKQVDEATRQMEMLEVYEPVMEAILFSMGESVETKRIAEAVGLSEAAARDVLLYMQDKYNKSNRGVTIIELENAFQMCTKNQYYEYLQKLAATPKNYVLTDVLLETLSIIAYKQPVTRAEIEKIRGVSCDHAVNRLVELGLACEVGRLDAPGRPLLFGTTEEFLRSFGVRSIEELPVADREKIEDFKQEAEEEVQLALDI